jgi:hypothetical protein
MFTSNEISVKEQLAGKRIMITGTTGFLGKVVIEKMIREIPDVEKIILVIRGNDRYPTARERFDNEIAVSTIFDRLKDDSPAYFRQFCLDKIECVTGELTEKNFGLSREDFTLLAGRVDVIIHVAGCVEFREQLQRALMINTLPVEYSGSDQSSGKHSAGPCCNLLRAWIQYRGLPRRNRCSDQQGIQKKSERLL